MKVKTLTRFWFRKWVIGSSLLAGACLAGWIGMAQDEDAAAEPEADAVEDEALDLVNWVEFGVGGVFMDGGSRAEWQRIHRLPEVFGGITGFHYQRELGKEWQLGIDGRGVFDSEDYSVKVNVSREDRGFVRVGYEQFRTWDNGAGGYLPLDGSWYELYDTELYTDRGEFWIEAGLTLPDVPKVTIGYHHTFRDGTKGSTIWGPATSAGLPFFTDVRGIVPTFLGLDEERDSVRADVDHQLGSTQFGVGVRYDSGSIDNTRNSREYPGQAGDAHATTREQVDDDMFNVHSFVESRLSEKVLFTVGYAYTDLDADTAGYRVYGTTYDPDLGQRLPYAATYGSLLGGSSMGQHTGTMNFLVKLHENLQLIPWLRVERQDISSVSFYQQPAGALAPSYEAASDRGFLEVSENLELRYTGFKDWVLYAIGNWTQGDGDLREDWDNLISGGNLVQRVTDDTRLAQKYTAGANWYPVSGLSVSGQYFHKIRENDYDHPLDSTSNLAGSPNRYPAFLRAQQFDTDDVNLRVSVRPGSNLSLVARYDFQLTSLESSPDNLATLENSEMTSHVASGGVSWVPFSRVYLLGTLSYVWDRTDTLASSVTATVADSRNDYWTATATVGYALDDKTDLQLQYLYYLADNYADNSAVTVPYGSGSEEHGVMLGVTRRLNARTRLGVNYGFFDYSDELSGGRLDYQAHVLYTTLSYRF